MSQREKLLAYVKRAPIGELLKVGEVATLFDVGPKTVTRWAKLGKLPSVRTLGGHRRFPVDAVRELLRNAGADV